MFQTSKHTAQHIPRIRTTENTINNYWQLRSRAQNTFRSTQLHFESRLLTVNKIPHRLHFLTRQRVGRVTNDCLRYSKPCNKGTFLISFLLYPFPSCCFPKVTSSELFLSFQALQLMWLLIYLFSPQELNILEVCPPWI